MINSIIGFYVVHYINEHKVKVIEGGLRCPELSSYLTQHNAPRMVWLSEDGTGVVSKIEYDATLDELVGLVLPIDQTTGMPTCHTFKARTAEEIAGHMNKPTSSHVYIVMAQPLKEAIPPFLLLMFGTDNKFKTMSVLQRWNFIRKELKK